MSLLELSRRPGRTTFRLSRPAVSGVLRPRLLLCCVGLAALTVVVCCVGIATGDYPISPLRVVPALVGAGDPGQVFIVRELRLPRALVAILAGAAFAVSGGIFQTITRNPLASPDMIGINAGATTAVVAGIVLGGGGLRLPPLGLAGGLAAAGLIFLLAWRRGATGYRIVLVGIAVAWMCTSATDYLLTRAQLAEAQNAVGWLVGNLNGRGWESVRPLGAAVAVLLPAAMLLGRWTRTLHLGDEVARGLGTPVQLARLCLLVVGVALVAFATAATGPVLFVALAAPQIAQRLAGLSAPPILAAALTGALMVSASDLLARWIIPDVDLPVGVVTGALGAAFLLWLLVRTNRAGSGG
ncbi:iron chelate uptake ABC transporter family permease subunit [Micromonospora sp. HM5-17]|jgi:iron complex transport system permease protein|uniref:FecCD family ABC transporter permease n=1 Tax=Micromonospora sp. HM5-17 TaxID=2487710 RepID=UPI000F468BCB|nr:iron chelate uptake ABC transporter family permease subunit [Micromonospora sp. HM5-17]ROT29893.1 iron ABC transporter permease [Micromonospora sp. HM5-17]